MIWSRLKYSVSFFVLILVCEHIYSQNSTKLIIGIGYEKLVPIDKFSDFFTFKKIKHTTEIQTGNGIVGIMYYNIGIKILPYFKTGYLWHGTLKKDTLIYSTNYSDEIKYRTIPFEVGFNFTLLRNKNFNLLIGLGGSYDIMTRNQTLSYLNKEISTTENKFGYSFTLTAYFKRFHIPLGFAKKGDFNFVYASIIIPIYPFLFRK
ncbi:MAG: hypothetical protein ACOYLE_06380 [Bacteroidales bacterium]